MIIAWSSRDGHLALPDDGQAIGDGQAIMTAKQFFLMTPSMATLDYQRFTATLSPLHPHLAKVFNHLQPPSSWQSPTVLASA